MSALGQKRTSGKVRLMSALPPIADIGTQPRNVRFVPKADIQSSSLFSSLLSRFKFSPVERFFYKFDGIDCCPKLNAKLVNRLFHRWWQVAPPVDSVTHCFLGGCYHLIDGDIAVGLRHSLSSLRAAAETSYLLKRGGFVRPH